MHRFAVQLYGALVERYGLHDEQTKLALRLVAATNPTGASVAMTRRVRNYRQKYETAGPEVRNRD